MKNKSFIILLLCLIMLRPLDYFFIQNIYLSYLYFTSEMVLLALYIFNNISYKYLLTKATVLLYIGNHILGIINIIIARYSFNIPTYLMLIFSCIFCTSLFCMLIYRYQLTISCPYDKQFCYLATRYPKNLQGLLMSLLIAPFGYYSIVIDGWQYLFKKGKLIKREFSKHHEYFLRPIPRPNIIELDSLLNTQWSWKNNCFTTFKKYFINKDVAL